MHETPPYQSPVLDRIGDFESLTRGSATGLRFDGNFTQGQPAPLDPEGRPLVLS